MQMRKFLASRVRGGCAVLALFGVFLAYGSARADDALEITKRAWEVEFQKPNPEKWVTFYAEDAVIEDLGAGETGKKVQGRNEILGWFKQVVASWTDSTYRPARILRHGNSTVIEWRWVGKQKKQFLDAPATENSVDLRGITIWDFEDGKVKHEVSLYNYATIVAQLGSVEKTKSGR